MRYKSALTAESEIKGEISEDPKMDLSSVWIFLSHLGIWSGEDFLWKLA